MSKKAKLYLLILINLIAWGYVGYRIYNALQGDDDVTFDATNMSIQKIDEVKKNDSIVLSLKYPDPFLKGGDFFKVHMQKSSTSNSSSTNATVIKTAIKNPSVVNSPALDIKYIGLVKNSDKGTQTAMISINGKSYFVNQKDVVEGLSLLEITKDFLKIKKGKEVFVINK